MKVSHVALAVRDLNISKKFYDDLFDMKLIFNGEKAETHVKFMQLKDDDGFVIELWENNTAEPLTENLKDLGKIGVKHVAFEVANVDEFMKKVEKVHANVLAPIKQGTYVKRYFYITDPDNIPIELFESRE